MAENKTKGGTTRKHGAVRGNNVVKRSTPNSRTKAKQKTKTAGAVKAGHGEYYFRIAEIEKVDAGTGYSTSHGGVVEGDRLLVGWIHKPHGTGSRMHAHKNEQFNYVVKGTLRCEINGVKSLAPTGTLIFVPANAPHTMVATAEEDVIFIAIKDLSQGIIGKAIDGTMSGPHYDPGFA